MTGLQILVFYIVKCFREDKCYSVHLSKINMNVVTSGCYSSSENLVTYTMLLGSLANHKVAYEEIQSNRDFRDLCVLCLFRQSFLTFILSYKRDPGQIFILLLQGLMGHRSMSAICVAFCEDCFFSLVSAEADYSYVFIYAYKLVNAC